MTGVFFFALQKRSRQSERPPSSGRRFRRAGSARFLRTKPVLSEVPTAREARSRRIEDRLLFCFQVKTSRYEHPSTAVAQNAPCLPPVVATQTQGGAQDVPSDSIASLSRSGCTLRLDRFALSLRVYPPTRSLRFLAQGVHTH